MRRAAHRCAFVVLPGPLSAGRGRPSQLMKDGAAAAVVKIATVKHLLYFAAPAGAQKVKTMLAAAVLSEPVPIGKQQLSLVVLSCKDSDKVPSPVQTGRTSFSLVQTDANLSSIQYKLDAHIAPVCTGAGAAAPRVARVARGRRPRGCRRADARRAGATAERKGRVGGGACQDRRGRGRQRVGDARRGEGAGLPPCMGTQERTRCPQPRTPNHR